jgi:acetate CoA/acetoacetate CoA-transferase alpha subunit
MKVAISVDEAVDLIPDGASVMLSGFMGVGVPDRLVNALAAAGRRNLTLITNDTAVPGRGPGPLIHAGAVKKIICSHMGKSPETQAKVLAGEIEAELNPQGTFVERVRAGGVGLGGILTPTGVGTTVSEYFETVEVDGKPFLLGKPIRADFALISAWRCDYVGNLSYTMSARNFNPIMAMAADVVIVEPHEIVPVGVISPDDVDTPGALVDHIVRRNNH